MKINIVNDIEDLNRVSKLKDNKKHIIFVDVVNEYGIIIDTIEDPESITPPKEEVIAIVFKLRDTSNNTPIAIIDKLILETYNHLYFNIDCKNIVFLSLKNACKVLPITNFKNTHDLKIICALRGEIDFSHIIEKFDNYCDFITFVESRVNIYKIIKSYRKGFNAPIIDIIYNSLPAYIEMENKGFLFDEKIKKDLTGQDVRNKRVYFTYNVLGSITGRSSSKIHPLSKDLKKFIYPDKDKVFVNFDYNAGEARVLAHYSEDENLLDIFKQDQDLHNINAALIFDKKEDKDVTQQERSIAKLVFFSIMNGISANTLAKDLKKYKINEDVTKKTKTAIQKIYQRSTNWINQIQTEALAKKMVINAFGRIRYLENEIKDDEARAKKQASNAIIQSTLSDIKLIALHDIHEKYNGILAAEFHDAILVELSFDNNINAVIKDILNIMSQIGVKYNFKCPLKACFEIKKHL